MRHKENAKAVEVTLHLPEHLVEHAKRFGEATQRDVGQMLAYTLEIWSVLSYMSGKAGFCAGNW